MLVKKEEVRCLLQAMLGAPWGLGICSICVRPIRSILVVLSDWWPQASLIDLGHGDKCSEQEQGAWGSGLEPDPPWACCVSSGRLPSSMRLSGHVSSKLAKASNYCLHYEYLHESKWEVTTENACFVTMRYSVTSGNSICDWTYFPMKFLLRRWQLGLNGEGWKLESQRMLFHWILRCAQISDWKWSGDEGTNCWISCRLHFWIYLFKAFFSVALVEDLLPLTRWEDPEWQFCICIRRLGRVLFS